MPTYDYLCQSCGHELEIFQQITAKPIKKCPSCGEMDLKRLIGTGSGVLFKGSGFYQTDYRSESYKKSAKADSPSGSSSDSSGDSSSKKPSSDTKKKTTSTKD